MKYLTPIVSLLFCLNLQAQMKGKIELPPDMQAPWLTQVTSFGQRCDWSHDGKRIIFLEKTFGDVYEVEVATGLLTPLTHHFFHEGFTRALYLANGDILLSGSKTFDSDDPWASRKPPLAELWVLKSDLSEPPTRLGAACKEGPTASRTQMKIAWTVDDIYLADIVYENGVPKLANQETIITSDDLPGDVHGWRLETQNFRPPHDDELIFNAHFPSIEYEAEVMGYDFETGKIVNYSQKPDRYDEPEGIFPDGKYTLVESTRHHPKKGPGRKTWDYIDIYKLALDGSAVMERITWFNKDVKYKATNPVISDDGRYMAFQYSVVGETTGIGHGIVIWDFKKEKETQQWENLLDNDLSKWELWMGVPHTTVQGLPEGTPRADNPKEGIPLGLDNDPKGVFSTIEEAGEVVLKITGEIYGGLTTLEAYQNFHFSAQVKFGDKKWEPRLDRKRDSGLLYHCTGEHGAFWNVWKRCVEYQVQESDMGDLFMLAGTGGVVRVRDLEKTEKGDPSYLWDPAGSYKRTGRVKRSANYENPHGEWTRIEVYAFGDQAIHLVNGKVVMAIDQIQLKGGVPLTSGQIQIQSEGAEVYYRDMKIRPILDIPDELREVSNLSND